MGRPVLKTELCDILGIEYPVISAGMGPTLLGETTGAPVQLVAAVSNAGGCGVLGASAHSIDQLREDIRKIKSMTDRPFGVDILLPKNLAGADAEGMPDEMSLKDLLGLLPKPYLEWLAKVKAELELPDVDVTVSGRTTTMRPLEAIEVILDERVPLLAVGLGNPGPHVEQAHAVGTKVLAITGNVKNARRMAPTGIDLLVAQGHEGGGHTGRIGTMALLPQVIDAAEGVPVLAAGGIGDGRGLAAALAMGCVGVWVGTRFLATEEGGALPINKQRIIDSDDEGTRVSTAYTGKTLRASYNRFHDLWDESGLDPLPFPAQGLISSALLAAFIEGEKNDYVGGLAGQVSGLIHDIKPARQVLEEMVAEAAEIIAHRLPGMTNAG
jgi:NAD(P)H-dependent flavin oxidoreductase YrpB (nitropropane dioxygenase family)